MAEISKTEGHSPGALVDLIDLKFERTFVDELPADSRLDNVPRPVRNACYTPVMPTSVRAPRLLAWSDGVGASLGISRPASISGAVAEVLGGNRVLPGMAVYAARYGGHQFGHWAGQLGDGRAMTLGEVLCPDGARRELQLKGAGPTPFSRTADGRAVLRSSVREFLCSEAMHGLGVPTTRALSLVATGDSVIRDMFYDGNPQAEPGAVVCRVASSFVRFGSFEILAAQQEIDTLRRLANYVINYHFPGLGTPPQSQTPTQATYGLWFQEICRRTATMVAHWMRVGFVHGVMNTDNMSILGLTIDYGPYGWLEGYDPEWTPNTTDAEGRRYCYGNQPAIAHWNLARLAGALAPLFDDHAALEEGLVVFRTTFEQASQRMWSDKLGLTWLEGAEDDRLLNDLTSLLQEVETDTTLFFRNLVKLPIDMTTDTLDDAKLTGSLHSAFYSDDALVPRQLGRLAEWVRRYAARVRRDGEGAEPRHVRMNRANPKYVPRNYLAQQAIDALAGGDGSVLERLMTALQRPYDEQPAYEDLAARRPEWARNKAGCSALSCSS